MPLLLMEPYSPSTPSPPPSLFCGSVWQRAVGGRAAAGGGAGVLAAQLERVLRWEGYQRALSGRHGGPAQRRWAAVGGGAAVGWAHLDGLHDAVQRPQARLGVHLAAGGCRSGRAYWASCVPALGRGCRCRSLQVDSWGWRVMISGRLVCVNSEGRSKSYGGTFIGAAPGASMLADDPQD